MSKHKKKQFSTSTTYDLINDDAFCDKEGALFDAQGRLDNETAALREFGLVKDNDGVWRDASPADVNRALIAEHTTASAAKPLAKAWVSGAGAIGAAGAQSKALSYTPCDHDPTENVVFRYHATVAGWGVTVNVCAFNKDSAKIALFTSNLVVDLAGVVSLPKKAVVTVSKSLAPWIKTLDVPHAPLIDIDWSDYHAPSLAPAFWPALRDCIAATVGDGGVVAFGCFGGHGRTGTALAALYLTTHDVPAADAIALIRKRHCPKAVEAAEQTAYLRYLARTYSAQSLDRDAKVTMLMTATATAPTVAVVCATPATPAKGTKK